MAQQCRNHKRSHIHKATLPPYNNATATLHPLPHLHSNT